MRSIGMGYILPSYHLGDGTRSIWRSYWTPSYPSELVKIAEEIKERHYTDVGLTKMSKDAQKNNRVRVQVKVEAVEIYNQEEKFRRRSFILAVSMDEAPRSIDTTEMAREELGKLGFSGSQRNQGFVRKGGERC
uniref:Uncharacterized protein n=1 Tax=Oryza glaberrima TaxID=4538 RepID=I1NZF5_ORYGL